MNHEPQTFVDLQDAGNAQSQLILQAIARHADWNTGKCYPSVATLSRMAKCSDKTVRRHLKRLEEDGFIELKERKRDNGSTSTDLITIVGYAEWIAANRNGGRVVKPRRAQRYKDDAFAQENGPGQIGHAPFEGTVQQESRGTGHLLPRGTGQQVSTHMNTSLEPQNNNSPPLPPAGGSGRGGRPSPSAVDVEAILARLREAHAGEAGWLTGLDTVLAPIARQRHLDAPSVEGSLAALGDWLASRSVTADEGAAIARSILDVRGKTVKPADIEREVKARLGLRPKSAALAGDAGLMDRWPQVLASLTQQLGPDKVQAWFGTLVIERFAAEEVVLATHETFIATYVDREFSSQLRLALVEALGPVRAVSIRVRKPLRRAA